MLSLEDKTLLIDLVKKYYDMFEMYAIANNQLYYKKTVFFPEIRFDLKGKAAGQYIHKFYNEVHEHIIRFNPEIYVNNKEKFEQTVAHEVAHLFAFAYNDTGHGKIWKQIMKYVFNREHNRCHSYDMSNVSNTKKREVVIYKCKCSTHEIGVVKHRNLLKQPHRKLICVKCNEIVVP